MGCCFFFNIFKCFCVCEMCQRPCLITLHDYKQGLISSFPTSCADWGQGCLPRTSDCTGFQRRSYRQKYLVWSPVRWWQAPSVKAATKRLRFLKRKVRNSSRRRQKNASAKTVQKWFNIYHQNVKHRFYGAHLSSEHIKLYAISINGDVCVRYVLPRPPLIE